MDVRTIAIVAVVLGTAVYTMYEYFSSERNYRQRQQYQAHRPRTDPPDNRTNRSNSSETKKRRRESMKRKDDCCAICLETLMRGVLIGTVCEHQFHYKCLSQWLSNSQLCPVCRSSIALSESG